MFIYKITNLVNNKVYIGLTTRTIKIRWKQHINASHSSNSLIARSIKKYGNENFKIEQIDAAYSMIELKSKEEYWIAKYQSNNKEIGLNLTSGGESSIPNRATIIEMISSRMNSSSKNYVGVYWSPERKSWFAESKFDKKSKRIRGFTSEIDAAIARDILFCKQWKECGEDFKQLLNFPENYEKYINGTIESPKQNIKIAYKKSKYHFVLWDKDQKQWYVSILYGENKKNRFKKGMFNNENEAAEMADYYNLMYLGDLNRINFKDKINCYQSKDFIPHKTSVFARKTSPYRWISFLKKKNSFSVDARLLKIRKYGFQTPEEAKQYRDIELTKLNIPIPD